MWCGKAANPTSAGSTSGWRRLEAAALHCKAARAEMCSSVGVSLCAGLFAATRASVAPGGFMTTRNLAQKRRCCSSRKPAGATFDLGRKLLDSSRLSERPHQHPFGSTRWSNIEVSFVTNARSAAAFSAAAPCAKHAARPRAVLRGTSRCKFCGFYSFWLGVPSEHALFG